MKNKSKFYQGSKGITLIALVVTIIVLLILAGISIQMLTGENSILINATNAKKSTGIAEVEEAARLVYTGLFASKYISGTEPTLDEVVAELRSQGYTITSDGATGSSITGIELVGGPNLAVATGETLEVEYTPISSSGEGYFAVVDGLKYEMTLDKTKGQINVSRTAAGSTGGDNEGNTTITVSTSDGNKATALIDEGNKKIRIKGEAEGTDKIIRKSRNKFASRGRRNNNKNIVNNSTIKYICRRNSGYIYFIIRWSNVTFSIKKYNAVNNNK